MAKPTIPYFERLKLIKQGLLPKEAVAKKKKPIPKVSKKRLAEAAQIKEAQKIVNAVKPTGTFHVEDDVNQWFEHFMAVSEPVCAECGMRADWVKKPGYEKIWRACQAHILPKKKVYGFPSLADNRDNHIILFPSWGGHLCGCHGFYDSSWYNSSTMKIWPQIVKIFKTKLYHLIPEKEMKNIPEILSKEINQLKTNT